MNHCINIACSKCSHMYCVRCEHNACPECGHQYLKVSQYASSMASVNNDFRRYSFLCKLLQMFARDDGFLYSIKRMGALIEMHLQSEDRRRFLRFNFSEPEDVKHANMRSIIHQIVNFKY